MFRRPRVAESRAALEQESNVSISGKPKADVARNIETGKSYAIPALEILSFDFLLNQLNRNFIDKNEYDTNLSAIKRNLRSRWGVDNNPFKINQLGHRYQG